jgi:uncharacterized protein YifN (PemK superfamily)
VLKFQPKVGSVVYCDYVGFIEPEMIKKRPVIVISKHKHHPKLLSVVPISTVMPEKIFDYHVEMDEQFCTLYLSGDKCWVKCDMFNVVSLERLNLVRDKKSGLRHAPNVGLEFVTKIKEAIGKVHGL